MVKAIELVRKRVLEIKAAPFAAARGAAPRIEARLRADATTRRGNVPSFGRMGEVPIATEVRGDSIIIKGPGWVLAKAQEKGQVEDWKGIVFEEAAKAFKRGLR